MADAKSELLPENTPYQCDGCPAKAFRRITVILPADGSGFTRFVDLYLCAIHSYISRVKREQLERDREAAIAELLPDPAAIAAHPQGTTMLKERNHVHD